MRFFAFLTPFCVDIFSFFKLSIWFDGILPLFSLGYRRKGRQFEENEVYQHQQQQQQHQEHHQRYNAQGRSKFSLKSYAPFYFTWKSSNTWWGRGLFFMGFYFESGLSNWGLILCSRDTCDLKWKCDNVLFFRNKLQFCRPF